MGKMAQGIPRWPCFALIFLLLLLLLLPNHWLAVCCWLSPVESIKFLGCWVWESFLSKSSELLPERPSSLTHFAWVPGLCKKTHFFFVGCFTSWLVICYFSYTRAFFFLSVYNLLKWSCVPDDFFICIVFFVWNNPQSGHNVAHHIVLCVGGAHCWVVVCQAHMNTGVFPPQIPDNSGLVVIW